MLKLGEIFDKRLHLILALVFLTLICSLLPLLLDPRQLLPRVLQFVLFIRGAALPRKAVPRYRQIVVSTAEATWQQHTGSVTRMRHGGLLGDHPYGFGVEVLIILLAYTLSSGGNLL